jgi:hypothetical protein
MPSATLLYTAQLLHPSDLDHALVELDVSVEINWEEGFEESFCHHDIYYTETKGWGAFRYRKHHTIPSEIKLWIRSLLEDDRLLIAKGIAAGSEDGVVEAPRPNGGRLDFPQPF